MNMEMILNGVIIPKPAPGGFQRTLMPNETNNITIAGTMYTDFINNRRSWLVTWKNITAADFQIIYNAYMSQYSLKRYCTLQFDAYGIYGPVKLNISPQDIKYNGTLYDVRGTIEEQYAIS